MNLACFKTALIFCKQHLIQFFRSTFLNPDMLMSSKKYLNLLLIPRLASLLFVFLGLFSFPVNLALPPSKSWQVYSCANERVFCVCVRKCQCAHGSCTLATESLYSTLHEIKMCISISFHFILLLFTLLFLSLDFSFCLFIYFCFILFCLFVECTFEKI